MEKADLQVNISTRVSPGFIQELICWLLDKGWAYTGGGINKPTKHHSLRFERVSDEVLIRAYEAASELGGCDE